MMKNLLNTPQSDLIATKRELKDLLTLYLDSEAADDTQDRRNKLKAINVANKILTNLIN